VPGYPSALLGGTSLYKFGEALGKIMEKRVNLKVSEKKIEEFCKKHHVHRGEETGCCDG